MLNCTRCVSPSLLDGHLWRPFSMSLLLAIIEDQLRDRDTEECKLGFNSRILFEKCLIFKAMIEFNEIVRFSKFQKNIDLFSRYHPEAVEAAHI
jgi:hypothetical protein